MKKTIFLLLLASISILQYGQVIADHTVVDKYDQIPQHYLDEVKKMLVDIAGESHSSGYRRGMDLLEILDSRYQVQTYDGSAPVFSDQYLRLGRHDAVGEADFYTTQSSIDSYKSHISSQNDIGNPYNIVGFGWCWDMTWLNAPGGAKDSEFNVRWAGSSVGGPEGNLIWGLNSSDETLTGNSVCMDTYLSAIEQYNSHCIANNMPTNVIFTTGPVDGNSGTENGFQREIKHDYIRDFVSDNDTRILFDYADILCWNNSNEEYLSDWNDNGTIRTHANIHPDNMMDYDNSWNTVAHSEDGDHIGEVGTLRLAKAMWWMLARTAGWDGSSTTDIEPYREVNKSYAIIERSLDEIRINFDDSCLGTNVSLYNIHGGLIEKRKADGNSCIFNTSRLTPGLYLINMFGSNIHETRKVVIQ